MAKRHSLKDESSRGTAGMLRSFPPMRKVRAWMGHPIVCGSTGRQRIPPLPSRLRSESGRDDTCNERSWLEEVDSDGSENAVLQTRSRGKVARNTGSERGFSEL